MLSKLSEKEREAIELIKLMSQAVMPEDATHGFGHVKRVAALCLEIGEKLEQEVDTFVLLASAYLHDIAREASDENHEEISAHLAAKLMEKLGVEERKIEAVVDSILSHSYSARRTPKYLEGRILSDADKLDAIGAIGIARVFSYGGKKNRSLEESIEHFYEKILKLKDFMYTDVAKKIAEERHKTIIEYIEKIKGELYILEKHKSIV